MKNNTNGIMVTLLIIIVLVALAYYLGYFPGTEAYERRVNVPSTTEELSLGLILAPFSPRIAEASMYGSGYSSNGYSSYGRPTTNWNSWWYMPSYPSFPAYPTYPNNPTYPTYPSYPNYPSYPPYQQTPRPVVNQHVNATYSLRVGQSIQVSGLNLTVLSINEDSRCPRNVQCIQAGTVRVAIGLQSATSTVSTQTISLNQSLAYGVYTIQFMSVMPEKWSTQQINNNDYVLVFNVRS